MEARIALKYSGPAVESGLMDVYEASSNMIALSEFIVTAAKFTFGETANAKAEVAGFGRGSFITDLVINVAPATAAIFGSLDAHQLWVVVKGAFAVWKHLKGSPPKTITNQGNIVTVENNDGKTIQININSLNLVFSEKGSESASRFIKDALSKPGMDEVDISAGEKTIGHVTQDEAPYFHAVAPSENITDVTFKMGLILEAPVFKDGNKWRFSDGQQSFFADIADKDFLAQVNSGERFGKGDVLYADVRINQDQSGMQITTTRTITKVHEHKIAAKQGSLFHP